MSEICVNCESEETMAGVPNSQLCGECYAYNKQAVMDYGFSK